MGLPVEKDWEARAGGILCPPSVPALAHGPCSRLQGGRPDCVSRQARRASGHLVPPDARPPQGPTGPRSPDLRRQHGQAYPEGRRGPRAPWLPAGPRGALLVQVCVHGGVQGCVCVQGVHVHSRGPCAPAVHSALTGRMPEVTRVLPAERRPAGSLSPAATAVLPSPRWTWWVWQCAGTGVQGRNRRGLGPALPSGEGGRVFHPWTTPLGWTEIPLTLCLSLRLE